MLELAEHAALLARGRIVNHYQPIVDLRSGRVLGVEALARLICGTEIIPPGRFLPGMNHEALEDLLFASLPEGLNTLSACRETHPALTMSFNVSPCVMVRDGFSDRLLRILDLAGIDPGRITLEILESDEFLTLAAARRQLEVLNAAGVRIALDDVGVGYSSLDRLRELSVDTIKLDQAFVRELQRQPESLHFVSAMLSLSRGLRNLLIVEGVETTEILEALGVMGVQAAQGYAIARPMSEAALVEWLGSRVAAPASRVPNSLLGAFASHLTIVEGCRALLNQPLKVSWSGEMRDPHECVIGQFFDAHGLYDSPLGQAHKRFHALIDRHGEDPEAWERAAADLLCRLQEAIKAQARPRAEPSSNIIAMGPVPQRMVARRGDRRKAAQDHGDCCRQA